MAQTRAATVNAYFPAYLNERLNLYAKSLGHGVDQIIEDWIWDTASRIEEVSGQSDFYLPHASGLQVRRALPLSLESRRILKQLAAQLSTRLGGEVVSSRRVLRWIVEDQLQLLGEL